MFERFTDQARAVVVQAQQEARGLRHGWIGTEHLLLALLHPSTGAPATLLGEAGVTTDAVRNAVQRHVGHGRSALTTEDAEVLKSIGVDVEQLLARLGDLGDLGATAPPSGESPRRGLFRRRRGRGHAPFTTRAKKVLELSLREALALRHGFIGSEHLLLGLLREGDGLGCTILVEQGVDLKALRAATLRRLDRAA
jgi:ATP-dependent Clp protease ATP-binding subunit ClpA